MSVCDPTSVAFKELVNELERRQEFGDDFATKCLAAMALLSSGWIYGDPEPEDDPDDDPDGGEDIPEPETQTVVSLAAYLRAA